MHQDYDARPPEHTESRCWYSDGRFVHELTAHLPFSIFSVTVGLMLAGLVCFFAGEDTLAQARNETAAAHANHDHEHGAGGDDHSGEEHVSGFLVLFHLFHPAHMLFSAAATAAMFMRYERNLLKSIVVGFSGAIVVCGISDIIMPHCSALIMDHPLPLHICVIRHPLLVLPFAGVGVALGILAALGGSLRSTVFSHSMHVFVSTMASIFYLIGAFGRFEWIEQLGMVFLFICVAVMVPCCLSDIVYPLLFTGHARARYGECGHVHPH